MFDHFALNSDYIKYWYLDSKGVPNVNEVRGKIILLNNFNEGYNGEMSGIPWGPGTET